MQGTKTRPGSGQSRRLHVWDLPTRLFHWLLAAAIPAAVATGMIGGDLIVWHGRLGLFILGLLAFRLQWGFIGARNARFINFVRGPRAIRAYLRGEWRGQGHNPLGALSVLAMLGLIGVQIGSGLFASDDIAFQGPLANTVSDALSSRMTALHSLMQYGLIGVVLLHAAAIAWYVKVRREPLLRPMLNGWKEVPLAHVHDHPDQHVHGPAPEQQAQRPPRQSINASRAPSPARTAIAFVVAVAIAGALVFAVAGKPWTPWPPLAPAAAAPNW